jgi:hypothetical protein
VWPGDTIGISTLAPDKVALSWGSAVGGSSDSEIYTTTVSWHDVREGSP